MDDKSFEFLVNPKPIDFHDIELGDTIFLRADIGGIHKYKAIAKELITAKLVGYRILGAFDLSGAQIVRGFPTSPVGTSGSVPIECVFGVSKPARATNPTELRAKAKNSTNSYSGYSFTTVA